MKISELERELKKCREFYGDITVCMSGFRGEKDEIIASSIHEIVFCENVIIDFSENENPAICLFEERVMNEDYIF